MDKKIAELVEEYKNGINEALDGDAVDDLIRIIWCKINLQEGNITEEEYNKLLNEGHFSVIFFDKCEKCEESDGVKPYILCPRCV